MDATVATGAAAMMAIRVLLDHEVKEEDIILVSLLMAESGLHLEFEFIIRGGYLHLMICISISYRYYIFFLFSIFLYFLVFFCFFCQIVSSFDPFCYFLIFFLLELKIS